MELMKDVIAKREGTDDPWSPYYLDRMWQETQAMYLQQARAWITHTLASNHEIVTTTTAEGSTINAIRIC